MARQRRGGFRPPELRGTLGTLLRTTLAQAGNLRDLASNVIERGAREGRARLDDVRAGRRRTDALAELGEVVLELIRNGEIDLGELPEVRAIVAHLDDIDASGESGEHVRDDDHDGDDRDDRDARRARYPDRDLPRAQVRSRFDDRTTSRETRDLKAPRGNARSDRGDDGTVSSSSFTSRSSSGVPSRSKIDDRVRVWRPVAPPDNAGDAGDDSDLPAQQDPRDARDARDARDERARAKTRSITPPARKGGISFDKADDDRDPDEDLADYMHPDDVPPKKT